ncbi:tetratricopeptide repeat protein [bacterium]|nr:tetratricopeptide repeat protein [bacterium]
MSETIPGRNDLDQGVNLILQGQMKKGMHKLRSIIVESPKCECADDAYYLLGLAFLYRKDTARACTCFSRILKHYPNSNIHRYAKLHMDQLQSEQDPAHESFLEGEEQFRDREYEKSLQTFHLLRKKTPGSALADNALLYEGLIYRTLTTTEKKPEFEQKARSSFAQILATDPDSDSADFIRNNEELRILAGEGEVEIDSAKKDSKEVLKSSANE